MKQILCAVFLLSTFIVKAQSSQWQLCNNDSCSNYYNAIIESSDTLFSGICISVDGGSTWVSPINTVHAYSYVKTSAGIFAGGASEIYYSNDNGLSWSNVHNFGSLCWTYGMAKLNDTVFAATLFNGIWMSPDNGLTWSAINSGLPLDSVYSILAVGNRLYAGTLNNGVYYSDDSGVSWAAANIGLPPNSQVRSMSTDNINIYASATGGLYYTNVGGTSWTQLGFPNSNAGIVYCVDNAILAAGYNGMASPMNLYRSLDQGLSWNLFDAGFPDSCIYVVGSLYATDSYVFCGMAENLCIYPEIYKIDRNVVISSLEDNISNKEIQLNVYPNPFSNQISFETTTDINSTIILYDVTKRKIAQQTFFKHSTFNTSNLESGVYFY